MYERVNKVVLTTGQIAQYLGVNFRTVIRWIQRGELKAFQLPGRGDNRVELENFIAFLEANSLPIPEQFRKTPRPVLIVEEDASIAKLLERRLKKKGFEATIAPDGFRAGTLLGEVNPSVVVLDFGMRGIEGVEVLRYIRATERLKEVRVLAISALPREELEAARKAGADDTLAKPFDTDVLAEKVEALATAPRPKVRPAPRLDPATGQPRKRGRPRKVVSEAVRIASSVFGRR
ncbi:MAG: response regulator [Planctomycetes bacterium]|nr:response regulator [Planctomycetota bacterium]